MKRRHVPEKKMCCEKCGIEFCGKHYVVETPGIWSTRKSVVCSNCYLENEKKLTEALHKKNFHVRSLGNGISFGDKAKERRERLEKKKKKEIKVARKKEQARLDSLDETKLPVI